MHKSKDHFCSDAKYQREPNLVVNLFKNTLFKAMMPEKQIVIHIGFNIKHVHLIFIVDFNNTYKLSITYTVFCKTPICSPLNIILCQTLPQVCHILWNSLCPLAILERPSITKTQQDQYRIYLEFSCIHNSILSFIEISSF